MFCYQPEFSQADPSRTAIIGVGGAGNNILELVRESGVSLYSANLDVRILKSSKAPHKIHLGESLTHGLGSGGDPQVGAKAAVESGDSVREAVAGRRLVVLIAGLGGGTGSGAAPVMAEMAKKEGAFVVSVVVLPFSFEGSRRGGQAAEALTRLERSSDIVLSFDNDRIESLLEGEAKALDAFDASNSLLARAVEAVASLTLAPGLFHLGLDDLRSVVSGGRCLFGIGMAHGEDRAREAASKALSCPLFASPQASVDHADVLVHVGGSDSLTVAEIEQAVKTVAATLPAEAQIHFGVSVYPEMEDSLQVLVFACNRRPATTEDSLDVSAAGGRPSAVDPTAEELVEEPFADQETDETDTVEEEDTPVSEAQLESIIRNEDEDDDEEPVDSAIEDDEDESVDYPAGPEPESVEDDELDADEDEDPVIPETKDRPFMGEFSFELPSTRREPLDEAPRARPEPRKEPVEPSPARYEEPSFKGLFSDDDPFIVDGEDLDLPPSMRKKK